MDKLNPQFENAKHLFKIIMPELVSMETYLVLCTHCELRIRDMVNTYVVEQNALRKNRPRIVHVLAHGSL